jgi:hypothetical protein
MAPDELIPFLENERLLAESTLIELVPKAPAFIRYEKLWPQVLLQHVVRLPDVNKAVARLYAEGRLLVPTWEGKRRVPQRHYSIQRE